MSPRRRPAAAAFAPSLLVLRASAPAPAPSHTLSPCRAARLRRVVRASLPPPGGVPPRADGDGGNSLHPSWRVYSQPGNPCVLCRGEGHVKCLYCYGEGIVRIGPEPARDTLACPQCKGAAIASCVRCEGTGVRPRTRIDVLTGETLANPTNAQLNTPKTQAEIDAQFRREKDHEADKERYDAAEEGDPATREDLPMGEGNNVGNLV